MKAESPAAAVSSEPPSLETALHKMRRSPDDQADDSSDMILLVAARAEQEYANRRRRERALLDGKGGAVGACRYVPPLGVPIITYTRFRQNGYDMVLHLLCR